MWNDEMLRLKEMKKTSIWWMKVSCRIWKNKWNVDKQKAAVFFPFLRLFFHRFYSHLRSPSTRRSSFGVFSAKSAIWREWGGGAVEIASGRTDDERVVRDYKPKPTAREVWSRKAVPRAVYWFERGGFLVLTGMPSFILGESCTTSIKDFAIFPPRQKKKENARYPIVVGDERLISCI